jgi:hypothetical protein
MMMKHVLRALWAIAALSLTLSLSVPTANAQSTSYVPPTTSSSPSTPPDNPGTPNGGPAGGPDLPPPPPEQQISQLEQVCNAALNKLAKVPPKLVVAFANEAGVSVVPVCNSGLGHKAKIDNSQALPLQHAIAGNAALMAALQAHGFHAEDVVGVVLVEGVATLYVHRGAA